MTITKRVSGASGTFEYKGTLWDVGKSTRSVSAVISWEPGDLSREGIGEVASKANGIERIAFKVVDGRLCVVAEVPVANKRSVPEKMNWMMVKVSGFLVALSGSRETGRGVAVHFPRNGDVEEEARVMYPRSSHRAPRR